MLPFSGINWKMCSAKVREKIQDRRKCEMQKPEKKKKKKERNGIPRKGEKRNRGSSRAASPGGSGEVAP